MCTARSPPACPLAAAKSQQQQLHTYAELEIALDINMISLRLWQDQKQARECDARATAAQEEPEEALGPPEPLPADSEYSKTFVVVELLQIGVIAGSLPMSLPLLC